MKERSILFSWPMVRAVLDGKKTQTRRVVKFKHTLPEIADGFEWCFHPTENGEWEVGAIDNGTGEGGLWGYIKCPYGKPGDRLWVRETWASVWFTTDYETDWADDWGNVKPTPKTKEEARQHGGWPLMYKADEYPGSMDSVEDRGFKWLPSIFMPRWASRIDLQVTGCRVERVQEITNRDAEKEGLLHDACGWYVEGNAGTGAPTARECFCQLWGSINGKKYPWKLNPFVWVIEFRKI